MVACCSLHAARCTLHAARCSLLSADARSADVVVAFWKALLRAPKEPRRLCSGSSTRCGDTCKLYVEDDVLSPVEARALIAHTTIVADADALKKQAKEAKKRQKEQKKHKKNAAPEAEPGAEGVQGAGSKLMITVAKSAEHGGEHGHVLLLRVLERIRRIAAVTFNISKSRLKLSSHFVSKITAKRATTDSAVHCDEGSYSTFHFSAVLWLNTYATDFEGGRIVFFDGGSSDGTKPRLRVQPKAGRLALFTSGWENAHRVEPVTAGDRWSIPVFLEVLPDPEDPGDDFASLCALPKSTAATESCMSNWPVLFGSNA